MKRNNALLITSITKVVKSLYQLKASSKFFACFVLSLFSFIASDTINAQRITLTGRTFDANNGARPIRINANNNGSRITNCTFRNFKDVGAIISINGARDVIIDNCRFLNNPGGILDRDIHAINIGTEGHDVIIRNCTFRDMGADGFQCGNTAGNITNILIENCLFEVTKPQLGENGVDIKQSIGPITVRNNVFRGFRPCAKDTQIGCTGSSGEGLVMHLGTKNVIIEGNTFTDCIDGIEMENAGDIEDVIIRNNIFHNNLEHGVNARKGTNIRIFNNTFVNNGIAHLNFERPVTGNNRNNLLVGDGSSNDNNKLGGQGNLVINRISDAKFVDVRKNNYRINSDSPAINAGVRINAVTKDIDGENRPNSGPYDTGADEFIRPQNQNSAPVITITSPLNNATFNIGEEIALTANASDPDGNLDKVNFKINGNFYKTDNERPFKNNFSPTEAGNYTIGARAFDKEGLIKEVTVNITVIQPNREPTVRITAPNNGQTFTLGEEIPLTVTASDPDGNLDKVNFKINGDFYRTDNDRPFEKNFNPTEAGSYTVAARAFDREGLSKEVSVTIEVIDPALSNTAFSKNNNLNSLKIYPNPAFNFITIDGLPETNKPVQIIDITGRILNSITLNKDNNSFSVSNLPEGMYFISYYVGGQKINFNFIKK